MDENITFKDYYRQFDIAAKALGFKSRRLSNGAKIYTLNPGKEKRLAVLAGTHGNEVSGPLSLLEWLQSKPKFNKNISYWICPNINNLGWDKNTRYHGRIDLNRHYDRRIKTPKFIKEIMKSLKEYDPTFFLDFHEDETKYNYLFKHDSDKSSKINELQQYLKISHESWLYLSDWIGAAETFVKYLGCANSTTLEASNKLPMWKRIRFNIKAIEWVRKNM